MRILLADDEKSIVITLGDALGEAGHDVVTVNNGNDALKRLTDQRFDLLITDVRMPGIEGMDLLSRAKALHADLDVFVMTGYASTQIGVEAMKRGASDFFEKPFQNEAVVEKAAKLAVTRKEKQQLVEQNTLLRSQIEKRYGLENLIGESPKMLEIYDLVQSVAGSDCNVLIQGETGTGKEEIAKAIHWNSARKNNNFVAMVCSTFSETLLEDELFGHERGAFTDAREARIGRFEQANRGTIFIDEIDDMSLQTQVKLLRVVAERSFDRLGGKHPIKVDIRLLAATKVSLEKMVAEGRFREDLFYRLKVVKISLPPLRERPGDVALLCQHFVTTMGKGKPYTVDPEVLDAMERYPWPGNVRQLRAAVESAIVMAGASLKLRREHLLPPDAAGLLQPGMSAVTTGGYAPAPSAAAAPPPNVMSTASLAAVPRTLSEVVSEAERMHIVRTLEYTKGHKGEAAKILGISRKNLWEKMKQYTIE